MDLFTLSKQRAGTLISNRMMVWRTSIVLLTKEHLNRVVQSQTMPDNKKRSKMYNPLEIFYDSSSVLANLDHLQCKPLQSSSQRLLSCI